MAALAISVAGVDSASGQSFCRYEVTAIIQGPSCGIFGPTLVKLLNLNDLGQACGYYRSCSSSDNLPFVWSEETGFVALPLPPGATSGEANDINNVLGSDGLGQVACTLLGPGLGNGRAYLYDDGAWTMLPPLEGGTGSFAEAINDYAQIAGYRSTPLAAFLWDSGFFANIPSIIGGTSDARGMNEAGVVVGEMGSSALSHAWMWDGVSVIDLGTLFDGTEADAEAVNAHQMVVGGARVSPWRGNDNGPLHSFLWHDGRITDLGLLRGTTSSRALEINDARQVLGRASTPPPSSETQAYLWQHGEMVSIVDLVDPVPGLIFSGTIVTAINNRGQIAAGGVVIGGSSSGLILTPIDRPLGDVNFDCEVNGEDLALVLGDWGPCAQTGSCICDIVTSSTFQPPGDGVVDGADLAVVLGNWSATSDQSAVNRRR